MSYGVRKEFYKSKAWEDVRKTKLQNTRKLMKKEKKKKKSKQKTN